MDELRLIKRKKKKNGVCNFETIQVEVNDNNKV